MFEKRSLGIAFEADGTVRAVELVSGVRSVTFSGAWTVKAEGTDPGDSWKRGVVNLREAGVDPDGAVIGIPESLTIYDMMVLGYAAGPPNPKEVRALNEIIHYDNCGQDDFRTDEQVIADAEKTWAWCMAGH